MVQKWFLKQQINVPGFSKEILVNLSFYITYVRKKQYLIHTPVKK